MTSVTNPAQQRTLAENDPRERLAAQARALAKVVNSEFDDEPETWRKLRAHGLADEEIRRQLATLSANTSGSAAVLTSYSHLHSLQHLDVLLSEATPASDAAAGTLALLRCVEICMQCSGTLAARQRANLEAGNVARAVANGHWRIGFHGLLQEVTALLAVVDCDPASGVQLDIHDSPSWARYRLQTDELHRFLEGSWREESGSIFDRGLDDPQRFVFFHEFVNVGDERCWEARVRALRLPGVQATTDESPAQTYARVVGPAEIARMLDALETIEETDLLPFRVVHQVSELLANHVNERFCRVVEELLLAPDDDLDTAARMLSIGNRLLNAAESSVRLMMRALTPAAYQAVRRNLGMVRGTQSMALRRVLFNQTYPLLVRAMRLRLSGSDEHAAADDELVEQAVIRVAQGAAPADRALADIARELVVFHQRIRTWRDLHQQLPKTHLGLSPERSRPTVSLSGSESAVDVAHELRKTHATDPIVPLYRALRGSSPPDVHELVSPGAFDEFMAHQTASAVFEVYAEVQERFENRRRRAR